MSALQLLGLLVFLVPVAGLLVAALVAMSRDVGVRAVVIVGALVAVMLAGVALMAWGAG